ncbi:MAG: DUF2085 domain-containing protein [Chloroflexi bacterium]|nr:DUF2085 domain-containing protein [Chloroflexota bacterium]
MQDEWNEISGWRRDVDRVVVGGVERFLAWFARHWLLLINASVALLIAISILDPYLMSIGLGSFGVPIFRAYRVICTQVPSHSYWPFGFQMAMCERDLAIFASFLLGGIAFAIAGRRWKAINWRLYLVLIAPLAIDGLTQLVGLRQSTWELRTVTGGLFGLANTLMVFPTLQWAMQGVATSVHRDEHPGTGGGKQPMETALRTPAGRGK